MNYAVREKRFRARVGPNIRSGFDDDVNVVAADGDLDVASGVFDVDVVVAGAAANAAG
jgi:hypothetical protein